jgi:hypothetical protein
MGKFITFALVFAGSAALAACANQPASPSAAAKPKGGQCFLASQVNGFSPVSDTVIDVQVGANRYYRLTVDDSCPDAVFRNRVALRTTGGGSWICQGLDAEIIVPDPMGGERCLVRAITPITKEQWIAGSRPK